MFFEKKEGIVGRTEPSLYGENLINTHRDQRILVTFHNLRLKLYNKLIF
jgi:hypothetical protein